MQRTALLQKIVRQIGVPVERLSVQGILIKTSYLSAGAGKPVLLIHGGDAGAGGIRWYPVIGSLSTCFRVIVPDVVGYGESDKPFAPYDRSFFSAWLKNFFDALGLKKVSVVGHSVGGAIAPEILLGLLFYGYATGVFSSRKMEKATYESIPFRFIASGLHPDHDTIANFRKTFLREIQELFVQILLMAKLAGLLKLGNISVDGSKIHADASKSKAVSYRQPAPPFASLWGRCAVPLATAARFQKCATIEMESRGPVDLPPAGG